MIWPDMISKTNMLDINMVIGPVALWPTKTTSMILDSRNSCLSMIQPTLDLNAAESYQVRNYKLHQVRNLRSVKNVGPG